MILMWNALIVWVPLQASIKEHHTFPVGAQRKVTDVYAKDARANHLLPDNAESAALCPDGDLATCIAAS